VPDLSLDLRHLRCALSVAELGSFRRAARALELSQSTVSRRVQGLEHRLGFPLFIRSRHGAKLTTAGVEFLRDAVGGAHQLSRAARRAIEFHRGDRGQLKVGVLASLTSGYLHSLLRLFRKEHPNIHVQLRESTPHEVLRSLTAADLDVSFVTGHPSMPGYEVKLLWTESIFVALPADHRLASLVEVTWSDIRGETFIVGRSGPGSEIENYLIGKLGRPGFGPRIDVHDVSRGSLLDLVAMGYGITLTSTSSGPAEAEGVAFRRVVGETNILPSSAVWLRTNENPALRHLLLLAERVSGGGSGAISSLALTAWLSTMFAKRSNGARWVFDLWASFEALI
jgi:DNA-binding transcriptional LysR family regulator